MWREQKRDVVGFKVRLGKRLFGEERERWFSRRADAERWVAEERRKLALLGQTSWSPNRDQLRELEEMVRTRDAAIARGLKLPSLRALIEQAIEARFAAQKAESVSLTVAIGKWEEAKAKKSAEHVAKCALVYRRFAAWFGAEKPISAVGPSEAEAWLGTLSVSENTRTRYAGRLSALWSWAAKPQRRWVLQNPWELVETEPLSRSRPGILTIEQVRMLLRAAAAEEDQPLLPFLVLALFSGPRIAENRRLDWSNLNLEPGEEGLLLDPDQTKTGVRRAVPLAPVAIAWLRYYSGPRDGLICPRSFGFRRERLLARAGFIVKAKASNNGESQVVPLEGQAKWKWPRNGLRHSYCSYALAHLRDAKEVALRAGHSERVLLRDYAAAVMPRVGDEYFSLFPAAVLGTTTFFQRSEKSALG